MTSQTVLGGVTFTSGIALALPTIPGLMSMGFFGTTGDNINTNRVPGGPTFVAMENAPVISSNFMTVGVAGVRATGSYVSSGGIIQSPLALTASGTLYVDPPAVAAATGTGFSATATVGAGHVTGLNLVSGGTGFPASGAVVMTGGNFTALNTQVQRSAAITAAGWSWMAVFRVPSSGLPSCIISDFGNNTALAGGVFAITAQAQANSLRLLNVNTVEITVAPSTSMANYHCIAATYSGGASGTFNLYNLTDNQTGTPWVATGANIVSDTTKVAHFGPNGLPNSLGQVNDNYLNTADISFGFVASGVLSLLSLQGIYASVKSLLARRSVSC